MFTIISSDYSDLSTKPQVAGAAMYRFGDILNGVSE